MIFEKSFWLKNSPSGPLLAHLLNLDLIALNGQGKTVLACRCHRKVGRIGKDSVGKIGSAVFFSFLLGITATSFSSRNGT
jgi:hypothetical protein